MESTGETIVIGVTIPVDWLPLIDQRCRGKPRATWLRELALAAIRGKRKLTTARNPGRPAKRKRGEGERQS